MGIGIGIRTGKGGSLANAARSYAEILRDDYGADEIWPLVDIASGTTIPAFVNSARNGTLTGWDLQNAAAPVPGTLAPYSDGANDYGNIYTSNGTTGLVDIWNGQLFSMFIWGLPVWASGTVRRIIDIRASSSNLLLFGKNDAVGTVQYLYRANNVTKTINFSSESPSGWHSFGMSVSLGADEFKAFFDGAQAGTTQTSLGTWSGTPASTQTNIGSSPTVPTNVWNGHVAYCAMIFGSIWTPAQFLAMHNAAATAGAD